MPKYLYFLTDALLTVLIEFYWKEGLQQYSYCFITHSNQTEV